jgi:hypothetical protein
MPVFPENSLSPPLEHLIILSDQLMQCDRGRILSSIPSANWRRLPIVSLILAHPGADPDLGRRRQGKGKN